MAAEEDIVGTVVAIYLNMHTSHTTDLQRHQQACQQLQKHLSQQLSLTSSQSHIPCIMNIISIQNVIRNEVGAVKQSNMYEAYTLHDRLKVVQLTIMA